MESLDTAVSRILDGKEMNAIHTSLCMHISPKWKHAAKKYHALSLTGESTYMLPIAMANEKMRVWIPWAIQREKVQLAQLAKHFPMINKEQFDAVDSLGNDESSDDEI